MTPALGLSESMMDAATYSGESLGFLGLPSERSARQLSPSIGDLLRSLSEVLSQMVIRSIQARTADEFKSIRSEIFPSYASSLVALSKVIMVTVPLRVTEVLVAQSFSEIEASFREQGAEAFGTDIRDKAIFTVWTLRKTNDLLRKMNSYGKLHVESETTLKHAECAKSIAFHSFFTRFHVDCLTLSMQHRIAVYPEVLVDISEGLRSAVDTYAWVRQSHDLMFPSKDTEIDKIEWDDEDQALLEDSMRDMDREIA